MKSPPKQGYGLHEWILTTSRRLLASGLTKENTSNKIQDLIRVHGIERTNQNLETEIDNAIEGAIEWLAEHPDYRLSRKRAGGYIDGMKLWSEGDGLIRKDRRTNSLPIDQELVKRILSRNAVRQAECTIRERWGAKEFHHTKLFFGRDYNVCAGPDVYNPIVKRLSKWGSTEALVRNQFIVPNVFLYEGKGGNYKNDANVGKRLYQIIEFDRGNFEEQMCLLLAIGRWKSGRSRSMKRWELAMVVFSGNKSLHGWFPCWIFNEREIKSFFRFATSLGADKHMNVPSQYTRMPNGMNKKYGEKQEVIYWNEEALATNWKAVGVSDDIR